MNAYEADGPIFNIIIFDRILEPNRLKWDNFSDVLKFRVCRIGNFVNIIIPKIDFKLIFFDKLT